MLQEQIDVDEIRSLSQQLATVRERVLDTQTQLLASWQPYLHNPLYLPSAANLAAYIGLRRHDLRQLQSRLTRVGLSSLGRCEGHVVATLDAVNYALAMMNHTAVLADPLADINNAMTRDQMLLRQNTTRLFAKTQNRHGTLLMVTMPGEAADDYDLVRDMLDLGMDCARINCAHDDAAAWERMVANIRQAIKETGRNCLIMFDLSGPKLRTGDMAAGPPILHIKIKRDEFGNLLQPTRIILDASGHPGCPAVNSKSEQAQAARLSVSAKWLQKLKQDDRIKFHDIRKRKREFIVAERLSHTEVAVTCKDGAYIIPGTVLEHVSSKQQHAKTVTGDFSAPPMRIRVEKHDVLLLTRAQLPGQIEQRDKAGNVIAPARIACTEPAVFDFIKTGHAVWIDDGRIGCLIEHIDEEGAWLRIIQVRPSGEHIGAQKGLNFPDTPLKLPSLTEKDKRDLDFAVQHADIIGLSFVQHADDLDQLHDALIQRNAARLGVIAKIETRDAVKNLPEIIVRGAGRGAFGIMIARGDLAVEIGYERMAEIQEEMLWLCEAAHIPVIWATQVLESLVKQDLPSRAEITDAAMSERAECVMLNKGPYILHGMSVLNDIIARMQSHQDKKTPQYRALHW
jgi:pyruvate kinase